MKAMAVLARARWVCIVCAAALGGALAGCVPDVVDVKAQCPQVACDPNFSFLYARASLGGNQVILAFAIHPLTGVLAPVGTPVPSVSQSPAEREQLSLSADGKYLFSMQGVSPASIESFAIQPGGSLLLANSIAAGGRLQRVVAAPDMGHVYGTDGTSPLPPGTGLREFALGSDGALTVSGSVLQPMSGLAVHPDSNFIFATGNSEIGIIQAIDGGGILDTGVTGNLGLVSVPDVAVDPLGEFVVAFANTLTPPKIGLFRFDPAGPALTLLNPPVTNLPCGSNLAAGTFDPTGQFLYVVCTSGPVNPIYRLEGRDTTPTLTLVDQLSFLSFANQNAFSTAIPRSGKFLYSAALSLTAIDGFSIDPLTGFLSPLPGSPFEVTGLADFLSGPLAAY